MPNTRPAAKAVARAIGGIGAGEGERVIAVELAQRGEREPRGAEDQRVAQAIAARDPRGEVAIAVALAVAGKAVDAVAALPGDAERHAAIGAAEGGARGAAVRAEAARLDVEDAAAAARRGAVDRDDAADRLGPPQRRLRAAHDLDPAGEVGIEQFEARGIARGGIIGADALDEEEGVVGLGAADADVGERPGGAADRDGERGRQAQQVGDERGAERARCARRRSR